MPGITHEQYLDEPGEAIAWMLRIHRIEERHREKARRRTI